MKPAHYHVLLGKVSTWATLTLLAGLALILAGLAGPGRAWGELYTPRAAQPGTLLINEVQYDPAPTGTDTAWEWFELYCATDTAVSLSGWSVRDNSATTALPDVSIPPRGVLVIAATDKFLELFPDFAGAIAYMPGGKIGGGLSNSDDRLILLDDQGTEVDKLSWGTDTSAFDPPCRDVAQGHSLERVPFGHDTDRASDFVDQENPTPGRLIPAARLYLPLVKGNEE